MILFLPLADINPFDATHLPSKEAPGFVATGDQNSEHLSGAWHARRLIGDGVKLRPIAVCASRLVPDDLRSKRAWQRLDGFKRYWAHHLAGKSEIACIVFEDYKPGCQHGETMDISEDEWAKLSTS
jgi:hypothetical protein